MDLVTSKPTLNFNNGAFGVNGWRLSFTSELADAWHQEVELTSGERLNDLNGTIVFENADTSEPHMGWAKGSLTYWEGRDDLIDGRAASYLITIRLSNDDLTRLTQSIMTGMLLKKVNIDVPIEYGWQPDGSGKKWDNLAKPRVEIEGYSLILAKLDCEASVADPGEIKDDLKSSQLMDLQRISKTVAYILYALVIVLVVLIVRLR
ncbi:hypothetical protein ACLB0R_00555 [Sphingomonas sp. GlSt437]|uniref:hypothetical protein n=1 Tax=Sphingomonas sp. GlSt437 TaxID=3389970 RepID=UPI003EBE7395